MFFFFFFHLSFCTFAPIYGLNALFSLSLFLRPLTLLTLPPHKFSLSPSLIRPVYTQCNSIILILYYIMGYIYWWYYQSNSLCELVNLFLLSVHLSLYLSIFSLSVQQNYKRLNNWRFSRNTKDIAATKRTYCIPSCKQNVTLVPHLWEAEWEGQFLYFFSQETLNGNKQNDVLCTNQID